MSDVLFRNINPDEKTEWGFVLKSWIRSYCKLPESGVYDKQEKIVAQKNTILKILRQPGTSIVFATSNDVLLGFAVFNSKSPEAIVHYVYVKEPYRRLGIGGALLIQARQNRPGPMYYTYKTPACARFIPEGIWKRQLITDGLPKESE